MTRIFLLDIDGVLLEPRGYRAALRGTIHRFTDSHLEVEEETLEELERRGISSEWDMAPLLLAAYWAEILSRQPIPDLPSDVASAASAISRQRTADVSRGFVVPEFALVSGQYPATTAFRAGSFPSIPNGLRRNLLTETRNVHLSRTTRTFQQFTLGSRQYAETYGLPAEFESESLLRSHDTSNIDDKIRAVLRKSGHLAAITSRPSRPPRELAQSSVGYAPEAELALELVGMADIPLVAFGKLEYLAAREGLDPAALVKPSPFQALAGVLAAWTGQEWSSLQAADHWRRTGSLNGLFGRLPKTFEIIVVEDTMGGIHAVRAAAGILRSAGLEVGVRAIGLTSGSPAKASAFECAGVRHSRDWQALIDDLGL